MSAKQTFRTDAWDPIKHNERVAILNAYSRARGMPNWWGRERGAIWSLSFIAELTNRTRKRRRRASTGDGE